MSERPEPDLDEVRKALREHDERVELDEPDDPPDEDEDDGNDDE
jgi:hypothetical protein